MITLIRSTMLFVLCAVPLLHAQNYPRWFLFPGEVSCRNAVTVITHPPSFYKDSAVADGFRLGCDLLARYSGMQIVGGQAFWMTEAGAHSMGASFELRYDTLLSLHYRTTLKVLESHIDKERTLVLVGDSSCSFPKLSSPNLTMNTIKQPKWVEETPSDPKSYYGVGFSQEFFYETSSWQTAEKNAYMALARSVQTSVKSMQKRDAVEAQDILDEQVDITLHNVKIMERWKDAKKKIYYVLARMEK